MVRDGHVIRAPEQGSGNLPTLKWAWLDQCKKLLVLETVRLQCCTEGNGVLRSSPRVSTLAPTLLLCSHRTLRRCPGLWWGPAEALQWIPRGFCEWRWSRAVAGCRGHEWGVQRWRWACTSPAGLPSLLGHPSPGFCQQLKTWSQLEHTYGRNTRPMLRTGTHTFTPALMHAVWTNPQ